MSGQLAAWVVIVTAAVGAAWLASTLLRRWPFWRWVVAALVLVWTATPYQFDDEHFAPALVVGFFRLVLEDGANPRPPFATLVLATIFVLTVTVAIIGGSSFRRRSRRGRAARKSAVDPQTPE